VRILYVGDVWEGSTARQRAEALVDLGHDVTRVDSTQSFWDLGGMFRRVVRKVTGHALDMTSTNRRMKESGRQDKYDIVWIDKGLIVKPATLKEVRESNVGVSLISYSPDDMKGRHNQSPQYLASIPLYDVLVTTKSYNVDELRALGARRVVFVDNAYDPATHRPLKLSAEDVALYRADIGFVGAYEHDRARHLVHLARAGFNVTVWGPGWGWFRASHPGLLVKRRPIYGLDYTKALNATKINLCFLRKLNRDLQTSRSVEIPACGAFMLGERTDEHERLFTEGVEAEYFEGVEELEEKCRRYLEDDATRTAIARRGRDRCVAGAYSNGERLRGVLACVGVD